MPLNAGKAAHANVLDAAPARCVIKFAGGKQPAAAGLSDQAAINALIGRQKLGRIERFQAGVQFLEAAEPVAETIDLGFSPWSA
jgi:hypothetical protein